MEPAMLHRAGQQAQHTTDLAIPPPWFFRWKLKKKATGCSATFHIHVIFWPRPSPLPSILYPNCDVHFSLWSGKTVHGYSDICLHDVTMYDLHVLQQKVDVHLSSWPVKIQPTTLWQVTEEHCPEYKIQPSRLVTNSYIHHFACPDDAPCIHCDKWWWKCFELWAIMQFRTNKEQKPPHTRIHYWPSDSRYYWSRMSPGSL